MAYQLPSSGFSTDGVRFKEMITSPALWETSNDGRAAQGTQSRRQGDSDLAFSVGHGDLLHLSLLFRDNLVWYFSTAKYILTSEIQKILKIGKRKTFFFYNSPKKKFGIFPYSSVSKILKVVILVLCLFAFLHVCLFI